MTSFVKPENALKRAEELLEAKQRIQRSKLQKDFHLQLTLLMCYASFKELPRFLLGEMLPSGTLCTCW